MNSLGQNTAVGSLSFLQGIFPTQELNQGLLHGRWSLYQLSYQRSPLHAKVCSSFSLLLLPLPLSCVSHVQLCATP